MSTERKNASRHNNECGQKSKRKKIPLRRKKRKGAEKDKLRHTNKKRRRDEQWREEDQHHSVEQGAFWGVAGDL